ncbi:MAG: L-seryl-tRNA(Sec) selenium transferase [Limnobacter sp.]|uniref:L-seryl-tRNA(Sec) selenium transferase n=1 Tax=Limnobacter sp. TaxID=2003368 RepID=UPI00391ACC96
MNSPAESMVHGSQASLKQLPAVDKLLNLPDTHALIQRFGQDQVLVHLRQTLADLRRRLLDGDMLPATAVEASAVLALAAQGCERLFGERMRRVFNLTGTVIHTNLGRSVLSQAAIDHVARMMQTPNNLEFDLDRGERGDRDDLIEELICTITGAEAATVVNNNAAAVLLTIAALARGKESIVSRGELVEIGGAFRMPDVMSSAGSTLVEVGTTNRTHLKDYEQAISPRTGLIMKVHTSNYVVQGFTKSVSEAELAPLARAKGIPLASDLGSGALVDMSQWGLPKEPLPQEALADGCDVVTFSGDKLLGGPQAGLIVGRRDLLQTIRKFPMKRALRLSKLPFAALEATLRLYLNPSVLREELPTLRLLTRPVDDIQRVAASVLGPLQTALGERYRVEAQPMMSQIGSGSLPVDVIPSYGLAVTLPGQKRPGGALDALATALRQLPVPVIGRIHNDQWCMDCRCLEDVSGFVAQLPQLRSVLA